MATQRSVQKLHTIRHRGITTAPNREEDIHDWMEYFPRGFFAKTLEKKGRGPRVPFL